MSDLAREGARARIARVRRQAFLRGVSRLLGAAVTAELLFACFALGHWLGPVPLGSMELLVGAIVAMLLGFASGLVTWRSRYEAGALLRVRLVEGRHRRRLSIHPDHLTIGQEIVFLDQLDRVQRESGRLLLRYLDPEHGGPVLRELEGRDVARVERMLMDQELGDRCIESRDSGSEPKAE